jgi:hypothetical protein
VEALVVDTGPLLAFLDAGDARRSEVRHLFKYSGPLHLSPFVLAEVDYFVSRRFGVGAELGLLRDVAGGSFVLEPADHLHVRACAQVIGRYRDLGIGLADASVAVLAQRHGTRRIATFDQRHFRAMRTSDGDPYVILPADEPPRKRASKR